MKLWRRLRAWWPLITKRQHTVQVQVERAQAADLMRIERDMWKRTSHLLREMLSKEDDNANSAKQ